jgi:hypothetical protein
MSGGTTELTEAERDTMPSSRMTSAEFAAARARLGWTPLETAIEYKVTPNVIEAFEQGSIKIPTKIARDILFRSALSERERVLAASGLPTCSVMEALRRDTIGKKDHALIAASEALIGHLESCTLCRERDEYAERHAPPVPLPPISVDIRIIGWAHRMWMRLPAAIRPPEGKAGEWRRVGILMGAALSAFASAIALVITIASVARVGFQSRWWEALAGLAVIIPMYFVGFFTAGWVWDLLRPIHDRFIGYVLRFALAGIAIYGAVAVAMPFLDKDHMPLDWSVGFVALMGGLWALLGAGLWVKDRLWVKLVKR